MKNRRTRLAAACVLIGAGGLAILGLVYWLTQERAPAVRVRWRDDVSAPRQLELERRYLLSNGQSPHPDSPRSIAYDLLDTSRGNIEALVTDPAIADTNDIDRELFEIPPGVSRGSSRIWLANRLPVFRHANAQWTVIGTLVAIAIGGLGIYAIVFGRRMSTMLRGAPFVREWFTPAPGDDDLFDTVLARFAPPAARGHRFSCAAKLMVASLVVVAIGVPILRTWETLLLGASLLALIFGVWRPHAWRLAAALCVALAVAGIKSTLPRADIAEGHNAFMVLRDGEALERGLPPLVFRNWKAQFDGLYPPDPATDMGPFQWRQYPDLNVPRVLFTDSADAIWRTAKYTRQVDAIGFRSLGEFRGGFVNESELEGTSHANRYYFWTGALRRESMPFYVMYELTPASVGSRLVWKGQAFWEQANGAFEEVVHEQPAGRAIAPEDAGRRVYAAFFPGGDRDLLFTMEPSLTLRMSAWSDALLSVFAAIAVVMLTTRVRWNAYVRALAMCAAGYLVVASQSQLGSEYLGAGYPPQSGGNDGMVHDGWGRMMAMLLRQGEFGEALRGAESVYWFTPGMRYFRMIEKLIFGDTNLLHALTVAAVPVVVFYLLRQFLRARWAWLLTAVFCLLPAGNLSFRHYVFWAMAGYGESLAAGLFLLGLVLMIRTQPRWGGRDRNLALVWAAGAALAVSMIIRPNFALAVVWLGAAYAWSSLRGKHVAAAATLALGLGVAAWMPFHNWYYGREFYLVSKAGSTVSLALGVGDYASALGDAVSARLDTGAVTATSSQLKAWLWSPGFVASDGFSPWAWPAHGLRLLALVVTGWTVLRGLTRRPGVPAALSVIAASAVLALVPMMFIFHPHDRYAMLGWDLSLVVLVVYIAGLTAAVRVPPAAPLAHVPGFMTSQ